VAHQAHAIGHAAVLLADRGVLLAGDMLSDVLIPRWRPASPPTTPTSTRCGEETNRSTRVWVKTGSPALISRTWSRPDDQPDELRRHRVTVATRSWPAQRSDRLFSGLARTTVGLGGR
jgi:hypothetical protein